MFYVYSLSFDGFVFYIGCTGRPESRYRDHYQDPQSACYRLTRYQLATFGNVCRMAILSAFESKQDALIEERRMIDKYSCFYPLLNLQRHPFPYTNSIPAIHRLNILGKLDKEIELIQEQLKKYEKDRF